jgi:hypothetical protein
LTLLSGKITSAITSMETEAITVINFLIRFDLLDFLGVRVVPWLDSRDMVFLLL